MRDSNNATTNFPTGDIRHGALRHCFVSRYRSMYRIGTLAFILRLRVMLALATHA